MPDVDEELRVLEFLRDAINTKFTNIVPHDKPDFIVEHRGSIIGIEITDGSTEEFRRGLVLARKQELRSFGLNGFEERTKDQRRTNKDLIQVMTTANCSECEISAVAWSARIADRIKRKCQLMQTGEIERFERNWLCVYNFQSDDFSLPSERHRDMLLGAMVPDPKFRQTFDVIYVLSYKNLFMIDRNRATTVDRKPHNG